MRIEAIKTELDNLVTIGRERMEQCLFAKAGYVLATPVDYLNKEELDRYNDTVLRLRQAEKGASSKPNFFETAQTVQEHAEMKAG